MGRRGVSLRPMARPSAQVKTPASRRATRRGACWGQGDALGPKRHPEEFLGVDGVVDGDEVGFEVGEDGVEVFPGAGGSGGSGAVS